MNAYMIYSRSSGSEEGAGLVFAHSVTEAKYIGWKTIGRDFTDEYLDCAVTRLRKKSWLFLEADPKMLSTDLPHVLDNPKTCTRCELWGGSPIGEDGLCEGCREEEE